MATEIVHPTKTNQTFRTLYAVCCSPDAFTNPYPVSAKIYKTIAAARKDHARITARMPYCVRINYMVCGATFDVEFMHRRSAWN